MGDLQREAKIQDLIYNKKLRSTNIITDIYEIDIDGTNTTLNDACIWASNQATAGAGEIKLILNTAVTHLVEDNYKFYGLNISFNSDGVATIQGVSGKLFNYEHYFSFYNCNVSMLRVHLDHPTMAADVSGIYLENSNLHLNIVDIDNFSEMGVKGIEMSNSTLLTDGLGTGMDGNWNAIFMDPDSTSTAFLKIMTFGTNTSDTNIPLNEIQYNGSYISNGSSALSFKA